VPPVTEEQVLERVRKICEKLPGSKEVVTYGHAGFKAGKRFFAVVEEYKKRLSIVVKVGVEVQDLFLKEERYYLTPYIGKQGWISLDVNAAPLDWKEIRELIVGSYQLVTTKPKRSGGRGRRATTRSS
jgi:predicted DNA-binding protein (MmcQ/YjbR family)